MTGVRGTESESNPSGIIIPRTSRRKFLQYGLAAGSAALLEAKGLRPNIARAETAVAETPTFAPQALITPDMPPIKSEGGPEKGYQFIPLPSIAAPDGVPFGLRIRMAVDPRAEDIDPGAVAGGIIIAANDHHNLDGPGVVVNRFSKLYWLLDLENRSTGGAGFGGYTTGYYPEVTLTFNAAHDIINLEVPPPFGSKPGYRLKVPLNGGENLHMSLYSNGNTITTLTELDLLAPVQAMSPQQSESSQP